MICSSKKLKKIAVILNFFLILSVFSPFINFAIAQEQDAQKKIELNDPKTQFINKPSLNTLNSFKNLSGSSSNEIKDQKPQTKASSKGTVDSKSTGKNSGSSSKILKGTGGVAYNWQAPAGDAVVKGNLGIQDIRENKATIGGAEITNKNQFNAGVMGQANGHAKFNKDGDLVDLGGGVHGFAGVRNSNTTTIRSAAGTTTTTVTGMAGAEGGAVGTLYVGKKGIEASGEIGGRIGAWVDASVGHNFEVDGQSVGGINFSGGAGVGLAAGIGGGLAFRTDKVGLGFSVALGPLKGGFSFYINPEGIAKVLEKRLPPAVTNFVKNTANMYKILGGKFKDMAIKGANLIVDAIKNPVGMIQVGMSAYFIALKKAREAAAAAAANFINGAKNTIISAGNTVTQTATNTIQQSVGIIQRIVNAATSAYNTIKSWF